MLVCPWRIWPTLGLLCACVGTPRPAPVNTPPPAVAPKPVAMNPAETPPAIAAEASRSSTVAAIAPTPAEPPPPRKSTAPLKVLILGDSMAATDFGQALEEVLSANPRITTARRGKSSTGLARPDFFDWMSEGPKQVERHKPELVLVILGGNDGQDLLGSKGGPRVTWGSKAWPSAYATRLRALSKGLGAGERRVVFLGLPLMARPRLEKKLELIRRVQEETLRNHPGTEYVDTRTCFVGKRGKLLVEVEVEGWKKPQPLRQDDGIHLTVPGARHFAGCVNALLAPILDESPGPLAG